MPVCKTTLHGHYVFIPVLAKAIPIQAWAGTETSRRLRLPELLDILHTKVETLLAFTPRRYPWY
jgi:hypothetical protein